MVERFDKIEIVNKITRSAYFYDKKIEYFKNQKYHELKSKCLKSGKLFEDPVFRPCNTNLYYTRPVPHNVRWMRPHEIVPKSSEPKFFVGVANANDLDQGQLGNCWFIAGCAAITFMPDLFRKVVPQYQTFDDDEYCGIFHFRFWIYGAWYDVVVDDYLPVLSDSKTLMFCSNKEEPNEFWAALLEKAYAKVCGSYENLEGGFTTEALIDMSGGIEESFYLDKKDPQKNKDELWKILCKSRRLSSMNGSYIDPDPYKPEERLPNGLIKGHAYTVTKIAAIEVNNQELRLIRVRNPWGRIEWVGPWSDNAPEWNKLSDEVKEAIEYKKENEGEFWMSFDDFYYYFDSIQFCHLTPDSYSEEILKTNINNKISWKMIAYHGEWKRNVSAGGSGNGGDKRFWLNPQFIIKLVDVDIHDDDNLATVIIALMQKHTREKRMQRNGENAEEFVQFRLYRVINDADAENAMKSGSKLIEKQLERIGNSGNYVNKREITKRFRVEPGYYLIVPSTFEYNVEGEFLVRIFTEQLIDDNNHQILEQNHEKIERIARKFQENILKDDSNTRKTWIKCLGSTPSQENSDEFSKVDSNTYLRSCSIDEYHNDNILVEPVKIENIQNLKQACSIM